MAAAQSGIKTAQTSVESAQANADRATRDEERYAELFKEKAASAQQAESARSAT